MTPSLAHAAFYLIPLLLLTVLVFGTTAAWFRSGATVGATVATMVVVGLVAVGWMETTWMFAERGSFRDWSSTPPPFALLVAGIVIVSTAMSFSELGRRLALFIPLWVHVAVQGFRLPLELAMHTMSEIGVMPPQMTYTGRNFDIVTGATAVVVAGLVATGRGGAKLVAAWNVMGLALLINVVVVAILATPRFRYFGDDHLNTWVTYPPYVWLPAVMVLAALAGHLIIFRALALRRSAASASSPVRDE